MSTGNKIGVLLEAGSVGSSCGAASSSGRVKIVSLPSILLLHPSPIHVRKEKKKKKREKNLIRIERNGCFQGFGW